MELCERVIGFDPNGHRRVYAISYFEAHVEAENYVRRRPDTGPLADWVFECEHMNLDEA